MFNGRNLPNELLLTAREATRLRNAIANNISPDTKFSKTQISKIIQSGEFWVSLLSKLAGPLIKVAVLLAKNILAPLGITAATSAIDAGSQKKVHGSGTKTLITSNKKIQDILFNCWSSWRF